MTVIVTQALCLQVSVSIPTRIAFEKMNTAINILNLEMSGYESLLQKQSHALNPDRAF